jgi:predicted RNase H-like nuclease (RuvC/YqgF family)
MKMQRTGHGAARPRSPEVGSEQRLQTLQKRVERLEMELEGLQDALYRHEVLQDRSNGKLLRRTEQIARDVSRDAGRRLL